MTSWWGGGEGIPKLNGGDPAKLINDKKTDGDILNDGYRLAAAKMYRGYILSRIRQ